MLTRLAHCMTASMLSFALATSASASPRTFSQAPTNAAQATSFELAAVPTAASIDRAALRAALADRRAHNLASFHAYRTGGVYPRNSQRVGPLNVWRDGAGHLCAAATMLDRDGQHELVMATAKQNNAIRLLDVTEGPILDWLMTSGFTLEEIDQIQKPMVMRPVPPPVTDPDPETTHLAAAYEATEHDLVTHANEGLDVAVDRLMSRPELANALIARYKAEPRSARR